VSGQGEGLLVVLRRDVLTKSHDEGVPKLDVVDEFLSDVLNLLRRSSLLTVAKA